MNVQPGGSVGGSPLPVPGEGGAVVVPVVLMSVVHVFMVLSVDPYILNSVNKDGVGSFSFFLIIHYH